MASGFAPVGALAGSLPGGLLLAAVLQWHLFNWFRQSELSADRFSLLVTGDLDVVQGMIVALAGGESRAGDEFSTDEFSAQAQELRVSVAMRKSPLVAKWRSPLVAN